MKMRLTQEREARAWSKAELARVSGLNVTTISLIEGGRFVPGPQQQEKLEAAFGIPAADLLDEVCSDASD